MSRKTRYSTLAAVSGVTVVLAVAVVAIISGPDRAGGGRDLPRLLPAGTVAYAGFSNISRVRDAAGQAGLEDRLFRALEREGEVSLGDLDAMRGMWQDVQSVQVALHRITVLEGRPDVDLLAVAGVAGDKSLRRWLPPTVGNMLTEAGSADGVTLHRLSSRELDREGLGLLLARTPGRVWASTDRGLLEDVLEARREGRERSLADTGAYRKIAADRADRDVVFYASAREAMYAIEGSLSAYDRDDFRAAASLLGLDEVEAGFYSADWGGSESTVRLLMDSTSEAYRLLKGLSTRRAIVDFLPESTIWFASGGVTDGQNRWERGKDLVCQRLIRMGALDSRREFEEELRWAERNLNVKFDRVAAVTREVGVFFEGELNEDGLCIFGRVSDPEEAETLIRSLLRGPEFSRAFDEGERTYEHRGVTIHRHQGRYDEFVWALADDCLLIAPTTRLVERAITARETGDNLRSVQGYREAARMLPDRNAGVVFVNLDSLLRSLPERDLRETPQELRRLLEGQVVGAALTVRDRIIELSVASGARPNLEEDFRSLNRVLGLSSRDRSWRVEGPAARIEDGARKFDPMQTACPICGQPIRPDYYVDLREGRIYFDQVECLQKFQQSPAAYLERYRQQGRQ